MDPYSSGEELIIKPRKPYTITKQRERWSEDEHNRFLEALKLYGRAWQRIEEHIGTKTAVQIRSHAQKFFTKLEKEALAKGVPVTQALDIEIPPPRPKRKPNNAYPRKTSAGNPASQVAAKDGKPVISSSSFYSGKHVIDLETEPCQEKPGGDFELGNAKDPDEENCTEGFSVFQKSSCPSMSKANASSTSASIAATESCTFREFLPTLGEVKNQEERNESIIAAKPSGCELDRDGIQEAFQDNAVTTSASDFGNSRPSHENIPQGKIADTASKSASLSSFLRNDMQATHNYPRHVPVHIVDGDLKTDTGDASLESLCQKSTLNKIGNVHSFHPLINHVLDSQHDNRSTHISSSFSSLIMSFLQQNPSVHAAASFAAMFWPCASGEGSSGVRFSSGQSNALSPSMAAIAGATVAAATAWWAAHGLLPYCTPFNSGFTSNLPFAPSTDDNQGRMTNNGTMRVPGAVSQNKIFDAEHFQDSDGREERKACTGLSTVVTDEGETASAFRDFNKTKIKKQIDRSSSGSNATCSSDIETDALEKVDEAKEDIQEPDASHPSGDFSNRRSRNCIVPNDSWKEVSQEGRLAFKALFSRDVLPQSFAPQFDLKGKLIRVDHQNLSEKDDVALSLGHGSTRSLSCPDQPVKNKALPFSIGENHVNGLLIDGLKNVKLKSHRTGFKPYKRCSVEAKENSMVSTSCSNTDEKAPKRMRLDGEAST